MIDIDKINKINKTDKTDKIDKSSDMPIYRQIYNWLYSEITGGSYNETGRLPCERDLKNIFGVERDTVRKALKMLVDDGLIIKVPGYGTKIANAPVNKKIYYS